MPKRAIPKYLARAISAVFLINIIVKVLGFGREMAIAHRFGANALTDAYSVAYTFPFFLQNVLGYALVATMVPLLTRYQQQKSAPEAQSLTSGILTVTALFLLIISLLGLIAAPLLVRLVAPGLDSATTISATNMTRIMFPGVFFMGLGLMVTAILNSRQRFASAALAPAIAALAVMVGAFIANPLDINLLAWATLGGLVLFLLIQLPALKNSDFNYQFTLKIRKPDLGTFGHDLLPIALSLSVTQVYTIVNRIFASGMLEGSISALNYAQRVLLLPLGLFAGTIITALYPTLASLAQTGKEADLARQIRQGYLLILVGVLPAALGLMALSQPIIELLFQSGNFDAAATALTAQALLALAPGLIFLALNMLLLRIFYALGDLKTPIYTGIAAIAVNILTSLLLSSPLQSAGLALANSLAAASQTILLLLFLKRRICLWNRQQFIECAKIAVAAFAMVLIAWLIHSLFSAEARNWQAVAMIAAIGSALIIYITILFATKSSLLRQNKDS